MIWLLSLVDCPRVVTDIKSPPCSSSAVSSLSPNRKSTYPSPPDNTSSMASVTVFSGLDLAASPLGLAALLEGAGWDTLFMEPGTATKNLTESRWPWNDSWAFTCNIVSQLELLQRCNPKHVWFDSQNHCYFGNGKNHFMAAVNGTVLHTSLHFDWDNQWVTSIVTNATTHFLFSKLEAWWSGHRLFERLVV